MYESRVAEMSSHGFIRGRAGRRAAVGRGQERRVVPLSGTGGGQSRQFGAQEVQEVGTGQRGQAARGEPGGAGRESEEAHLRRFAEYSDAGYDEVYINQIGPGQLGFFDFHGERILPQLKGMRSQ